MNEIHRDEKQIKIPYSSIGITQCRESKNVKDRFREAEMSVGREKYIEEGTCKDIKVGHYKQKKENMRRLTHVEFALIVIKEFIYKHK